MILIFVNTKTYFMFITTKLYTFYLPKNYDE